MERSWKFILPNKDQKLSQAGHLYILNAKMGNPELFPGLPIFLVGGASPNPPGTLKASNGCAYLQNAFVQERVKVGSSFSISASFSMPRMWSPFALTREKNSNIFVRVIPSLLLTESNSR